MIMKTPDRCGTEVRCIPNTDRVTLAPARKLILSWPCLPKILDLYGRYQPVHDGRKEDEVDLSYSLDPLMRDRAGCRI